MQVGYVLLTGKWNSVSFWTGTLEIPVLSPHTFSKLWDLVLLRSLDISSVLTLANEKKPQLGNHKCNSVFRVSLFKIYATGEQESGKSLSFLITH